MPIVFIHGVSNRDTPEYRENEASRSAFIRRIVLPQLGLKSNKVAILSPYWGDNGVKFYWKHASYPGDTSMIEEFGAQFDEQLIGLESLAAMSGEKTDFFQLAKSSLPAAIDMLWATAMSTASEQNADALAVAYIRAHDYAEAYPSPSWVTEYTIDKTNFVSQLFGHMEKHAEATNEGIARSTEGFGFSDAFEEVSEAFNRVRNLGNATLGGLVGSLARRSLHLRASMFIGDVFEYLNSRETGGESGPISKVVEKGIRAAKEKITDDDPKLIVIGHSLGGVIAYDLLTSSAKDVLVDMLVTVGSQVALFEEMKLYRASDKGLPKNPESPTKERVAKPNNIAHWFNVLDKNDVFSFRAAGVFNDVTDYIYSTGFGLLNAHTGYFSRPSFYERLGSRLAQIN